MNCEHCQELLSLYLDSELDETSASMVRAHLALCGECAEVCEDLSAIIDTCRLEADSLRDAVDSQSMWKNISRTIERDSPQRIDHAGRQGWFKQIWRLTLPQVVASVAGTVVITSLLTFLAFNGIMSRSSEIAALSDQSLFEKMMVRAGLMDSPEALLQKRIEQRKQTIDFWNRKIEARRVQWDGHFRDAFDRNLGEIEQVVNEYSRILEQNPNDTLTGEMLDSALNDKEELLRAFSEL